MGGPCSQGPWTKCTRFVSVAAGLSIPLLGGGGAGLLVVLVVFLVLELVGGGGLFLVGEGLGAASGLLVLVVTGVLVTSARSFPYWAHRYLILSTLVRPSCYTRALSRNFHGNSVLP